MSSQVLPRADVTETVPVDSKPPLGVSIRVVVGKAHPERYRFGSGVCRIGAGTDADIVIDDKGVSRRHAELELVPEGLRVRDLGSRNGTFSGGQRIETAILALGTTIQLGATELRLEADLDELNRVEPAAPAGYGVLLGAAAATRRLFGKLQRLEGCLVSVLIEGESGTGKELVARAIHDHSRVNAGPFVAVNCGALDRQLAKSELFGHKKGAFTGATENRVGVFEAANGGTLFLDELGELPIDVQPMLLRVLETSSVVRLGENEPRPIKVRIVAATNRDLSEEVRAQRFREDLYYRTTVVRLTVPPLRERLDDVERLARHFAKQEGLGELPTHFVHELRRHHWPGNVRELKNAVQAYAALGTSNLERPAAPQDPVAALQQFVDPEQPYALQKERLLDAFMRVYLQQLLDHTEFNQTRAARLSGLERSYLGRLLTKYGIEKK